VRRNLASVASLGGERKQPSHFLTTVISPPNAAVSGPTVVVLRDAGGGLLAGHANARRASVRAAVVARRPTDMTAPARAAALVMPRQVSHRGPRRFSI